jgi:hypothetical protein
MYFARGTTMTVAEDWSNSSSANDDSDETVTAMHKGNGLRTFGTTMDH